MIELVIAPKARDIGGFEVARVLPQARRRMIGPFVFFDRMGPVDFPAGLPRTVDVRPHPHIGLATVTYLFAGEIMHRDSLATEQAIRPGEVNWMVAGRGITHSERFEKARAVGDHMHGIQAWVALPEPDEECEPHFAHHGADALGQFEAEGVSGRLVAGAAFGLRSPVRTHSPLCYVDLRLAAGARLSLAPDYPERAVFVVDGEVEIAGQPVPPGHMAILAPGRPVDLAARRPAILLVLGGEPLGPRHIEWNFVSSSKARIAQAKADWRAGRMKLPDLDHEAFIPLPPDPAG